MIRKTKIEGLYIFEGLLFSDIRGDLIKPFSKTFFTDFPIDINIDIKETWFTKSKKNVIRAMHLQIGPKACEKIVSVINGAVLDVILDIRKDSPTYGKTFEVELNDINNKVLYIPKGCAHGYRVLEDNTITMYMATETHDPENDIGIRWDSFGYDWNLKNPILSDKDLKLPKLGEKW